MTRFGSGASRRRRLYLAARRPSKAFTARGKFHVWAHSIAVSIRCPSRLSIYRLHGVVKNILTDRCSESLAIGGRRAEMNARKDSGILYFLKSG